MATMPSNTAPRPIVGNLWISQQWWQGDICEAKEGCFRQAESQHRWALPRHLRAIDPTVTSWGGWKASTSYQEPREAPWSWFPADTCEVELHFHLIKFLARWSILSTEAPLPQGNHSAAITTAWELQLIYSIPHPVSSIRCEKDYLDRVEKSLLQVIKQLAAFSSRFTAPKTS